MPKEPKLPSSVQFASFLAYNPRPTTDVGRRSKRVCEAVKTRTASWARARRLGERLRDELGSDLLAKFLGPETTLVPMPGHARMREEGTHWPARELCKALVESGVGARWSPLLERVRTVPKSAWASQEERAALTPQRHFESLRVKSELWDLPQLTVVDDVVTSGKSLLAAVARLQAAYPDACVQAFALIRTMSYEPVEAVKCPAEGVIVLEGEGTKRRP